MKKRKGEEQEMKLGKRKRRNEEVENGRTGKKWGRERGRKIDQGEGEVKGRRTRKQWGRVRRYMKKKKRI